MKRIGKPYDKTLRETEYGYRLYQTWRKLRKKPHCEEWEYFPNFYFWAMKNGYTLGAWLRLKDRSGQYCSENCTWYSTKEVKQKPTGADLWIENWNRTVNRIRKHYGMPPLEGTEYDD